MYRHVVILVDRNSNESRQKSMLDMKRNMESGISVLVFPEGTMNKSKELLQSFKNGAFTLAIETQKPIIPMIMLNARNCFPREPMFALQPGIIDIHFLTAIETLGSTRSDLENIKSDVFNKMEVVLKHNKK